jgi:hypothetical protein
MSVVGYLRDVAEPENYFEIFAGRVSVGRADSNDIKLASRSVSSHHAELEIEPSARPSKMVVTDLGSRNATFVNEVRLLGSSRAVAFGDVLRFGYDTVTYRLVQELEGPRGQAPAAICPLLVARWCYVCLCVCVLTERMRCRRLCRVAAAGRKDTAARAAACGHAVGRGRRHEQVNGVRDVAAAILKSPIIVNLLH